MVYMKFTKMHGLGNDYVYVDVFDERVVNPVALARAVSDRRTGIGSDGLILIGPSETADVRMKMYNADGSAGQMCGNGIRCVVKYAVEHGLAVGPNVSVETDAGLKSAACDMAGGIIKAVRVDMGTPSLAPESLPSTIQADRIVDHPLRLSPSSSSLREQVAVEYALTCVSTGNPHAVIFVDDLETVPLNIVGPRLEHAPEFPERINVHFARVDSPSRITVKTWERGSGATKACGTGACAVCVAGVLVGKTKRKVIVTLPGGDLDIQWADNDRIFMTGPAVEVFTGHWPD